MSRPISNLWWQVRLLVLSVILTLAGVAKMSLFPPEKPPLVLGVTSARPDTLSLRNRNFPQRPQPPRQVMTRTRAS